MKTISLTFILIFTSSILAQNFWQPLNGPQGSTYVTQISLSPHGQLFLGTLWGGIYRSSDNGNTWVQKVNGFPGPIYEDGTVIFAFNNQGHIYATSFTDGILRSTNNGDSWVQTGLNNLHILALGINENGHIFAGHGGGGGVYKSTDNGNIWIPANNGLPQPFGVYAFLIRPGGLIFAGGNNNTGPCLYKSTNNGDSWLSAGLTLTTVNSLALNSNGDIYAGSGYSGVFRSSNNGENWIAVNTGLTCYRINQVSCNTLGLIFAATDSALFRSTNNGSSWAQIGFNNKYVTTVLSLPNGSYFAGVSKEGLFRSSNNGANWMELKNGIKAVACYSAAINQSGHIFVTIENRRMQRTTDNGNSWQELQNGVSGELYGRVSCAPNNYLFVSGDSGTFRSTDNGNNWMKVFGNIILFNDFVFRQNGQIFACSSYPGFGVWTSTNNGLNWVSTDPAFMASVYSLAINSSGYLFAGTAGGGIYRSTNSGANWIHYGPSGSVRALTCGTSNNVFSAIETSGQKGIFRSTDNGINWQYTGMDLYWGTSMRTNSSGHIYASSLLTGVYRSTDNGNSWVHLTSGMFNNMVWDLAFNSQGYLYAATWGNSVYRSVNPTIGIQQISSEVPNAFSLSQNYPNPFNPSTNIEFAIAEESSIKLSVYDILGREIEILANEKLKAGIYKIDWNASDYPSGEYFYKLQTESFTKTRKMIFVK